MNVLTLGTPIKASMEVANQGEIGKESFHLGLISLLSHDPGRGHIFIERDNT